MIEIKIEQGCDQWHVERFRCVTGTKIESAVGACFSNATQLWSLGGSAWSIIDGVATDVSDTLTEKKLATLKAASKSKQKTLMLELMAERQSILEIDDYCSADMERGNILEPFSVAAASDKLNRKFEACGMLQSETEPRFKFSPDAVFFNNKGVINGGYETKSKAGKKHVEYILDAKVPTEHLWQCLCPMIMDDCVKWWVFGSFDDRNHMNPLFTCGIKRDDYEVLIAVARLELASFFKELDLLVANNGGDYNDY